MTPIPPLPPQTADQTDRARVAQMRETAVKFEAAFLTQVLDLAGVGKAPEGWGGGAGEDAFRGQLLAEQGRILAESGGVGIAEQVFRQMLKSEGLSE
jgi:Rod binding domain-containing protein